MSQDTHRPAKGKAAAEGLIWGLAAITALILLNTLTSGWHQKVDLTEHRIYSLSPSSQKMIASLPERMIVKGYFGNNVSEVASQRDYVANLLGEYADSSGGKLSFEKIDPWDKPELQAELKKEGIDKLLFMTFKDDKREQVPGYFHVRFTYLDKDELWIFDQRMASEGLEYDFSTRIKRLAFGKKKVGITTGFGEPDKAQALSHPQSPVGLTDIYEPTMVNWQTTPKSLLDVDALIVNGPTEKVSDAAKYYLDQHLMKGKPILFLVRGIKWQAGGGQQQMAMMQQEAQPYLGMPASHGLGDLLAHYGFEVGQNTVMDVKATGVGVMMFGQEQQLVRGFVPIARVLDAQRKGILEGIEVLVQPFASTLKLVGPLEKGAPEGGSLKKLFETSAYAFVRDGIMAITPDSKIEPPSDLHGPYPLAYAVSGKFKSFFDGKPRPEGVEDAPPPSEPAEAGMSAPLPGETLKQSPVTARVIIVSGAEFAEDKSLMLAQRVDPTYANGFRALHNMVDWLIQDQDLVSIRSKQVARPLEPVDNAKRLALKYGNLIGVPLALIVFGILYWSVRERRRRHIEL
jgi:gliding-associated putative ABC transporter substrate-binding component GldG